MGFRRPETDSKPPRKRKSGREEREGKVSKATRGKGRLEIAPLCWIFVDGSKESEWEGGGREERKWLNERAIREGSIP